jgi:hypothetical protein
MLCGFFALAGGFIVYLILTGAWEEFRYIQFSFLPHYQKLSSTPFGGGGAPLSYLKIQDLFRTFFVYPPLLALSLLACFLQLRNRDGMPQKILIVAWGIVGLLNLYLQGKFYIYHFVPLLPPISIGASIALCTLFEPQAARASRIVILIVTVSSIVFSVRYANPRYSKYCLDVYGASWKALFARLENKPLDDYYMNVRFTSDDFSFPADVVVANYLSEKTKRNERIFIWGMEPIIYWLAERKNVTPFVHNSAFRSPWTFRHYAPRFSEELFRAAPRYVVIVKNDPLPWMLGTGEDSWSVFINYPELNSWLQQHYVPETIIEDFIIYARKDENHENE